MRRVSKGGGAKREKSMNLLLPYLVEGRCAGVGEGAFAQGRGCRLAVKSLISMDL